MRYYEIITETLGDAAGRVKLYHLTDNANFKLDPNFAPEDNTISIYDRSGHKGIYLTPNVEKWVNGHGYWRPFVAEIYADRSALEHDRIGRWGGEVFIPADQFDKLTVNRVIPLDAYAREEFGSHGWIERSHGHEFDTGNRITAGYYETPFRGYTYDRDTRSMPHDEIERIKQHFDAGLKVHLG